MELIPRAELTNEQIRAVELPSDQHRVIIGGPGSGKTQVLLHRADHLRRTMDIDDDGYYILVFTRALKQYLRSACNLLDLNVGNIDTPLKLPKQPWDIAFVSFEISRRHRFHRDLATLPDHVTVHVLPTGSNPKAKYNDIAKLRYNHGNTISARFRAAYEASREYLAEHVTASA